MEKISNASINTALGNALKNKLIGADDTAAVFYDLSFLSARIEKVKQLFPGNALNAAAIKACPLISILKILENNGIGLEAASLPEVYIAEKAGYSRERIVFDSPAKTREEIEYAVKAGIHINADSLEELEIIDSVLEHTKTESTFGLRINPQVGTGKILITSVAGEYSKFGVPVKEFRQEIINAYLKYEWLTGIHIHIGSQGCPLDLFIKGIEVIYTLSQEVNNLLRSSGSSRKISIFDIGGGFPVSYHKDDVPPSIEEYAAVIKNNFPLLYSGEYKLITEFGRYYFANSAFAVSRIDTIKHQKGISTIVSHLGADFLIRRAYIPDQWHHDFSVADKNGNLKDSSKIENYIIGGPLCFAGDVIAKDISLPAAGKGDYLIMHDVGAYTLSMWSRYNSRQIPKIIGYYNDGRSVIILKEREKPEDVVKFWE